MGDGELAEGSVWEGAMAAPTYGLDNLCALVDRNRLQISGCTEDVMHQDSQEARWAAFGWNVLSIPGNDLAALDNAFGLAAETKGKPTVIIANTTKGFGSALMEDKASWHHHLPNQEEYDQIVADFAAREEGPQCLTPSPTARPFATCCLSAPSPTRDIVVLCSDSRGSASLAPFFEQFPEQAVEVGHSRAGPREHCRRPCLLRQEGLCREPRELRLHPLLRAGQGRLRLLQHQRHAHPASPAASPTAPWA